MLTVYDCITTQHDLRLVALAALICLLAASTAVSMLHHAKRSDADMGRIWITVAAIATGFGIWATHFIAMLAYQPGLPSGYNVALTIASLVAAISLTASGLGIALWTRPPLGRWLGGAVVGGGIAVMHYMGMAAFEIAGHVVWNPSMVAASVALGAVFGAASLPLALRNDAFVWKALGAVLLTIAICGHHFTAMAAAAIVPDPRLAVPELAVPPGVLALAVACASLGILLLTLGALALDAKERRRAAREAERMRNLADAAVEGLVVCKGTEIVAANNSFAALAGDDRHAVVGRPITAFFPAVSLDGNGKLDVMPGETTLCTAKNDTIPVELIQRDIVYAGRPHQILAVRDVRERKKAEEEIYFLAHHDPLTKLPNRNSFNKRLEAEIAAHRDTDRGVAVLFLDLDRFKEINDLFGHPAGDSVLQFVAERIQGVLRHGAMVARLGGDEFAVIVPRLPSAAYAVRTAEAILEALKQDGEQLPAGITVETSIGIAFFPQDAADRESLLSHADAALYEAKADGRGVYRFFEASMGAHLRDRRQIEHDIRHAIARNELSVVYQPQADIRTGEIVGFEALLRWKHPTKGQVSPSVFIPIAEECGAIIPIGEWVLRTACKEAARWQRPLSVAINVSALQLHSGNLPQMVADVLDESGLDPARLELEITETSLVKDVGRTLTALRRLKALGVRIAMDDFGTGYSSLSNLRAFPFDKIKIDQSFVRSVDSSPEAAAIVRAVVGLAQGLDLPVLAEGVETDAELNFLRNVACNSVQGYLLGQPAPISAFSQHVEGPDPTLLTGRRREAARGAA